jgi:hypothetical protein
MYVYCIIMYMFIYIKKYIFQNMQLRLVLTREIDYVNIWLEANITDVSHLKANSEDMFFFISAILRMNHSPWKHC